MNCLGKLSHYIDIGTQTFVGIVCAQRKLTCAFLCLGNRRCHTQPALQMNGYMQPYFWKHQCFFASAFMCICAFNLFYNCKTLKLRKYIKCVCVGTHPCREVTQHCTYKKAVFPVAILTMCLTVIRKAQSVLQIMCIETDQCRLCRQWFVKEDANP